jgi:hypothetical protein
MGDGGRWAKAVGIVSMVLAAVLVIGMLAFDAFGRAAAGERLVDAARPTVGEEGIVELRSNLDVLVVGFDELGRSFPVIAEELGVSEAELDERLRADYPDIAVLLEREPEIRGAFEKTVRNLESHQDDFDAADDIPVGGVPMNVVPWAMLGLAIVLGVVGFLLWRTGRRWALWVVALIGVVLVVGTLALRIPQKSDQAADLVDSLTFSEESAAKTREQFEVAAGFVDSVLEDFIPDLAEELGTTTEAVDQELGQRFPRLAEVRPDIQPALDRIELDVQFRETRFRDGQDVQDMPLRALPWFVVGFGVVLVAIALVALVADRRSAGRRSEPVRA